MRYYLVLHFVLLSILVQAQQNKSLHWVKRIGGSGADVCTSTTIDAAGNIYSAGSFKGSASFDSNGTPYFITSAGGSDVFITKTDGAGNLLWIKQFRGTGDDAAYSINNDLSGNIYITGTFKNTIDMDPGSGTYNLIATDSLYDTYVSKLDASGNFLWAKQFAGVNANGGIYVQGRSMTIGSSGNLYISGTFYGTVDFDPSTGINNLTSDNADIFILKLDNQGNFLWVKQIGGTGHDNSISITSDNSENLFITGHFSGTTDFDPGMTSDNLTSSGNEDIYILKLNSSGGYLWAKAMGGPLTDEGLSVALDLSGNVYMTGNFSSTADFDPGSGTFSITSAGSQDFFISKLDASGNFVWAKGIGGSTTDNGNMLKSDGAGNIYVTGYFSGIVDFDPGSGTDNHTATGTSDIFVLKLDAAGNNIWSLAFGDNSSFIDAGRSIAIDNNSNLIITGAFSGSPDFNPDAGNLRLYSHGDLDGFIVKLGPAYTSSSTDYFRSQASGSWNDINTWASSADNVYWYPSTTIPGINANLISIMEGDSIFITENTFCDQLTINGGGSIYIVTPDTLFINDGDGFDITVEGVLYMQSGGNLTLRSTSSGTASVGNLSAGSISANVTVERFISSLNNRAYRLLAPSVNTTGSIRPYIKSNWQEGVNNPDINTNLNPFPGFGTHITGSQTGANGFDASANTNDSLYTFDQNTQSWVPVLNTSSTIMNGKNGYMIYIRGDRSINLGSTANPPPSSNTTLRATGTLLRGTQTFTGLSANGFSLIANPFASAINWSGIYLNNSSGFADYYTYMEPGIGTRGGFVTVNNNGVNSINGSATVNIQSGQSFLVRATGSSTNFSIRESDKSSANNIDVFRVSNGSSVKFTTALYFNDALKGRILADGVTASYNTGNNAGLDNNDAIEMANWDENIALLRNGSHLSIEERPLITARDTLFLYLNHLKQQSYEFEFNPENFNANIIAQLADNYTGTKTVINIASSSSINFTVTSDPASYASDRFYIIFTPGNALPVKFTKVSAYQRNDEAVIEWDMANEKNIDRYEVQQSENAIDFHLAGTIQHSGNGSMKYSYIDKNPIIGFSYYRIKAIDQSGIPEYSPVVRLNMKTNMPQLSILTNPVRSNRIEISINKLLNGIYSVRVINNQGQVVFKKSIDYRGGMLKEYITMPQTSEAGAYHLIIKGNRLTIVRTVIIY